MSDTQKTASGDIMGKAPETSANKSIEEMLDEVDDIIMSLENGDIALEDSFKIYEKGMKMIQTINSRIDKVEKKIIQIEAKEPESNEA